MAGLSGNDEDGKDGSVFVENHVSSCPVLNIYLIRFFFLFLLLLVSVTSVFFCWFFFVLNLYNFLVRLIAESFRRRE